MGSTSWAKGVTLVLHPNCLQLVVAFTTLHQPTLPASLWLTLWLLLLPFVGYWLLLRHQPEAMSTFSVARQLRLRLFGVNVVCLLALLLLIGRLPYLWQASQAQPVQLVLLVLYLLAFNLIAAGITLFYKISLHVMAAASSCMWLVFFVDSQWLMLLGCALVLLVIAARWALKAHSWQQLLAGAAAGCLLPLVLYRAFDAYFAT